MCCPGLRAPGVSGQAEPHCDPRSFAVARPDQRIIAYEIDQGDASSAACAGHPCIAREHPDAVIADDDDEVVLFDMSVEFEAGLVTFLVVGV